jgi:hypothetical protein
MDPERWKNYIIDGWVNNKLEYTIEKVKEEYYNETRWDQYNIDPEDLSRMVDAMMPYYDPIPESENVVVEEKPKKRGRPKGSKNKKKPIKLEPVKTKEPKLPEEPEKPEEPELPEGPLDYPDDMPEEVRDVLDDIFG